MSDPTSVTAVVDEHVRRLVAAAAAAARDLEREVEQASLARGRELRQAAERDALAIRRSAEAEAEEHLAECHRRVEAFAAARIARLEELSDGLLARAEVIHGRLPEAEELHASLQDLVAALAAAARAASEEAARPAPDLPRLVPDPARPPRHASSNSTGRPLGAMRELPRLPRPKPTAEGPSSA